MPILPGFGEARFLLRRWNWWVLILWWWIGLGRSSRDGCERRRGVCRQFRIPVFRRADVSADMVCVHLVHYNLHRLRIVDAVDPHRLLKIYVLLFKLLVLHLPFQTV